MTLLLRILAVLLIATVAAPAVTAQTAAGPTTVDLELVLAVDVSLSMDLDEQRLQRDGYIAAFRDPEVQKVITSGPHARIAVTYLEWAGPGTHKVVVPWMLIDGART